MEGELVSPLLMAPVHIDPSCLHPDLLTEVQHVVIAREQLLLHLNQIIGRGEGCSMYLYFLMKLFILFLFYFIFIFKLIFVLLPHIVVVINATFKRVCCRKNIILKDPHN